MLFKQENPLKLPFCGSFKGFDDSEMVVNGNIGSFV